MGVYREQLEYIPDQKQLKSYSAAGGGSGVCDINSCLMRVLNASRINSNAMQQEIGGGAGGEGTAWYFSGGGGGWQRQAGHHKCNP